MWSAVPTAGGGVVTLVVGVYGDPGNLRIALSRLSSVQAAGSSGQGRCVMMVQSRALPDQPEPASESGQPGLSTMLKHAR